MYTEDGTLGEDTWQLVKAFSLYSISSKSPRQEHGMDGIQTRGTINRTKKNELHEF